ncbi:nucleoside triphosphate pyrophosphatase [Psychrobacillus sp. OK032]|uniref:Maf family protein n=1 Tax=Psychrobacillus sp. OK032 TaxID=1884358 RepID=UPI0008C141A1|nr:Maf family protein [Psychrobacillus sp. OK032]SER85511.1 septum formation protein [Psychrobacillus sp. OK032]
MKLTTDYSFILASESPRRKELFSRLAIPFEVQPAKIDEAVEGELTPEDMAISIAYKKTVPIVERNPNAIVIGADTIVHLGKEVLGKPTSKEQAKEYLKKLSGRTHHVVTGVSIHGAGTSIGFAESTLVKFYELTDEQIDAYVATGDSLDKAGAYGIQTMGVFLVEKIEGDYNNVVGLPISRLFQTLLTLEVIAFDKEWSK